MLAAVGKDRLIRIYKPLESTSPIATVSFHGNGGYPWQRQQLLACLLKYALLYVHKLAQYMFVVVNDGNICLYWNRVMVLLGAVVHVLFG